MANPSYKTVEVTKMLDELGEMIYGRSASASIAADVCVRCGKPAVEFTDELSRREFAISGLCQECQDFIFNPEEE
jgi:hypothetical protein